MLTLEPTSSVLQLTLARGGSCCHCDYSCSGTSEMLLHIVREHLRARGVAGGGVLGNLAQVRGKKMSTLKRFCCSSCCST